MDFFGYCKDDVILCELCSQKAVDLHHIECRGMGGSTSKDYIENIMALCREHHEQYGDKKNFIKMLRERHLMHINIKTN